MTFGFFDNFEPVADVKNNRENDQNSATNDGNNGNNGNNGNEADRDVVDHRKMAAAFALMHPAPLSAAQSSKSESQQKLSVDANQKSSLLPGSSSSSASSASSSTSASGSATSATSATSGYNDHVTEADSQDLSSQQAPLVLMSLRDMVANARKFCREK